LTSKACAHGVRQGDRLETTFIGSNISWFVTYAFAEEVIDNRICNIVKLQPGMKVFVAWWD
jgi:hypothetical protein